jgi:quinol monooxygenase YgiN
MAVPLTAPTRAEAGNLQYDLYRSPKEKNRFLRIERWTDAAALEAHKQTPYTKESFAKRQQEGWTTRITLWEPAR